MAHRRHDYVSREDLAAIIAALAVARQKLGISQRELSRRLDLHPMTIMRLERGGRDLTLIEFLDISDALALNPVDVLRQVLDK